MKKILILLFLLLFPSIHSFAGMRTTMDRLMESWTGENINSVVELWGLPSEIKTTDEGKIYYWNKKQDIIIGSFNFYGNMYGGTSTCSKSFEVDENDIIIKGNWSGNACPMTYRGIKKYLNPKSNYRENR